MHSELAPISREQTPATKRTITFKGEIGAVRRFCRDLDAMEHRGRRAALLYVVARYFGNYVADTLRQWGSK